MPRLDQYGTRTVLVELEEGIVEIERVSTVFHYLRHRYNEDLRLLTARLDVDSH